MRYQGITPAGIVAFATALLLAANGSASGQAATEEESLYERLGGLPAISLVVDDFMDEFIRDPMILANPAVRERKSPQAAPYIKYQVTTLMCEVTGGPCQYTGLGMEEAHRGLNVTAEEWDRMGEIFVAALDRHQVPEREKEELLAILGPVRDEVVVAADR